MKNQKNYRMPRLDRIRDEQDGPRRRDTHKDDLGNLDNFSAIVTIGDTAEVDRQQQKRSPVADLRKSRQRRRSELLIQQPITHDVLDVVRHHREHRVYKEEAEAAMVQRGKRELFAGLWQSVLSHAPVTRWA